MLDRLHAALLGIGFQRACANIPFIYRVIGRSCIALALGGQVDCAPIEPNQFFIDLSCGIINLRNYYHNMMYGFLHTAQGIRLSYPPQHVIRYDIYTKHGYVYVVYSEF